MLMWKLVSVYLEIVLIFTQDRCMLGAEHNLAHKSFWTHLLELLGDVGHVKSCFGPFGDSVNLAQDACTVCVERTIGSEIDLDAPIGTPR